jgi:hypothetical protein
MVGCIRLVRAMQASSGTGTDLNEAYPNHFIKTSTRMPEVSHDTGLCSRPGETEFVTGNGGNQ